MGTEIRQSWEKAIPKPQDFTALRPILAYSALLLSPFFFSSNAIFGRMAQDIEPFTLAFLRWSITGLILVVWCQPEWKKMWATWRTNIPLFLGLGWLGMWLAGGVVYRALHDTTATNGLLIYTLPPIIVVLIEGMFAGRRSHAREWLGMAAAFIGVLWIMIEGQPQRLVQLKFNPGDLLFVVAVTGWAFYTLGLRRPSVQGLGTAPLLCLVALSGTVILAPFMLYEVFHPASNPFPGDSQQWWLIGGIVLSSSLAAFICYNFGVRVLGASIASIFMYLLAPCGIVLAWIFLGEAMEIYHWFGAGLVIGGVVLATLPFARIFGKVEN